MSPEIASLLSAVLGAVIAAPLSLFVYLRQARVLNAANVDITHAERIIAVEDSIDEEVLCLYGIYLNAADKDDKRVTAKRIRYVVAILNAQNLRFGRNQMGENIDPSELRKMFQEDYMPRFFEQEVTRNVWRQARRCFRKVLREPIDEYLTNKHGEKYDPL